jgi:hypothetical protein
VGKVKNQRGYQPSAGVPLLDESFLFYIISVKCIVWVRPHVPS